MTFDTLSNTCSSYGSINIHQASDNPTTPRKERQKVPLDDQQSTTSWNRLVFGSIAIISTVIWLGVRIDEGRQGRFPALNDRLPENTPLFFDQKVDHLDPSNTNKWKHRYYAQSKYFLGPGHPIILIVGGEEGNDDGFFYPFIEGHLAEQFGAFVIHPEHRFYGISQPVDPSVATTNDLKSYFTVKQAISDMLAIVEFYQQELGCSKDKHSPEYCPVISVGGSYPGFLSAIMRLHYSDVVDIGYASSAPLLLYSMDADQFGYFDTVTSVAEKSSPGCAEAVRSTLAEVDQTLRGASNYLDLAHDKLNICPGSIPSYIKNNAMLSEELMLIIGPAFADMNMFNYPPDRKTDLHEACRLFQDTSLDSWEKLSKFWRRYLDDIDWKLPCFDMKSQLPAGPRATLSASDWSGVGSGHDGEMFDFHCCSTLTPAVGFSNKSMFPHREWTLEWLTQHCLERFDVIPDPYKLVREFKFTDLVGQGATRILFTNGLNDLWSAGAYLESLSDSLLVINMPNSAHHSEFKYTNHQNRDTADVRQAHENITSILSGWLMEVKGE